MTLDQVIKYFAATSQQDLGRQIGVTQGAISQWKSAGEIPVFRQIQIEMLTSGELKADRHSIFVPKEKVADGQRT